ncbi:MAG: DUF5793 family protein [Halobacteriota archaeon]
MRRDYFDLAVTEAEWVDSDGSPAMPRLVITYDGPRDTLRSVFELDEEPRGADTIDVAFRLRDSIDATDAEGVLSVADRLTGDFLIEVNTGVDPVLTFLRAARRYCEAEADAEGRYALEIRPGEGSSMVFEKGTFLVYNADGSLLRQHSLIPSGVEL